MARKTARVAITDSGIGSTGTGTSGRDYSGGRIRVTRVISRQTSNWVPNELLHLLNKRAIRRSSRSIEKESRPRDEQDLSGYSAPATSKMGLQGVHSSAF